MSAAIVEEIHFVVLYIRSNRKVEVGVSKEVSFLDRHVKFPYRELRRSHITLYKDCDSILLRLQLFIKSVVFDCKRRFG